MKIKTLLLITSIITACNSQPKDTDEIMYVDTTYLDNNSLTPKQKQLANELSKPNIIEIQNFDIKVKDDFTSYGTMKINNNSKKMIVAIRFSLGNKQCYNQIKHKVKIKPFQSTNTTFKVPDDCLSKLHFSLSQVVYSDGTILEDTEIYNPADKNN